MKPDDLKELLQQTAKKVAKAIYQQVDEWRKSPELDPRDSYDYNALDAYNNVCEYICGTYGIEVDDE